MNDRLDLASTTVTLFGDGDPLDEALGLELTRRGCVTHRVSVPTGWLRSATHAVVRVDTEPGAKALAQLAEREHPQAHVIAVCAQPAVDGDSRRVNDLCESCGVRHNVSLIWHAPFGPPVGPSPSLEETLAPTHALAGMIADHVAQHIGPDSRDPSFAAHTFDPDLSRHNGPIS